MDFKQKGINVLSLFDGMSCGQIALDRLGVKVNNYYASEIDKYAIQITKKNYPATNHLGDVTKVKGKDLPTIDLIMGGSPCQGFSYAGKQLNFNDPRSKLFFEFARLIKECKPKYFLLENVNMKQQYQDVISNILGVQPIMINSSLVSGALRKRLYWTNIPDITQPDDKNINIIDILQPNVPKTYQVSDKRMNLIFNGGRFGSTNHICNINSKSITLTASMGMGGGYVPKVYYESTFRTLTPVECERLQTVPDNYTHGVSNSQRYKMLGNGWTVDVIAHILNNMV